MDGDPFQSFEPYRMRRIDERTDDPLIHRSIPVATSSQGLGTLKILVLEPDADTLLATILMIGGGEEGIIFQSRAGTDRDSDAMSKGRSEWDRGRWLRKAIQEVARMSRTYGEIDVVGCLFHDFQREAELTVPGPLVRCEESLVAWYTMEAMEAATEAMPGVPVVAIFDEPSEEWAMDRSRVIARKLYESA